MKDSRKVFKKAGLVGIGLCALCCALPMASMIIGVGSLTVISLYFEWAGIAALVLAIGSLGWAHFQGKKKAPSCDVNCPCSTNEKP